MPDDEIPSGFVETGEKIGPKFLLDLQDDANEIRRACRRIVKLINLGLHHELANFSGEIQIMLKAYVNQVVSLADTRYAREELEKKISETEDRFWEETEKGASETPWQDFTDFVLEVLKVCQNFLEPNGLILTSVPVPEDFVESLWDRMMEEREETHRKERMKDG